MLKDGQWTEAWQPVQASDSAGRFLRQTARFRNWVTIDGAPGPTGRGGFAAEAGRYHLYVALICPWASRTLMVRALKGLEDAIGVTILEPALTDQGWHFGTTGRCSPDPALGAEWLHRLYTHADPGYSGRATVPVLWDRRQATIVNNESADIIRMMDQGFASLATRQAELYPADLAPAIDALNQELYERLNNGVYRAGFALTQQAYEEAASGVFVMLDALEAQLRDGGPYLFGARFTESDVRLFVTLARFDAAYHGLFKCNIRRLADYPALSAYLEKILALPGIRGTVDLDHIKRGYYSIKALNPAGIVPLGPALSWAQR